jgi:hypothetical protein
MKQPNRGVAIRVVNVASTTALVLGVLFLVGSAGASIDGPEAVRAMAWNGAVCVAAAVTLKVLAEVAGRRERRAEDEAQPGNRDRKE